MTTQKCRSCGASIVWVKTREYVNKKGEQKGGASMPIDAATANGSSVFNAQEGHISHFATCPNATQHRKAK